VSLLLRDELRIVLSPTQVSMVHLGKGLQASVVARQSATCDVTTLDEVPWVKALDSLEAMLSKVTVKQANAKVMLSNHFVRYVLVPWSDQISDENEEQAFIRHSFVQTYGVEAQRWALRMSPGGYGDTQVASAVDQALLDGLERILAARGIYLASAQPYLMTAYNRWLPQLDGARSWFVLVEPGRLCLSLLHQGRWSSLQTAKIGDNWPKELQNLLERELLVSEASIERGTVYLFAPGRATDTVLPGWKVQRLGAKHGIASDTEMQFPLSMSE